MEGSPPPTPLKFSLLDLGVKSWAGENVMIFLIPNPKPGRDPRLCLAFSASQLLAPILILGVFRIDLTVLDILVPQGVVGMLGEGDL